MKKSRKKIESDNKSILLWIIAIIVIAFIIFFAVKFFIINVTGNAITGNVVSDDLKVYANNLKSAYGTKCNSPKTNAGSFYIGKYSKKDYSGINELDISSLSGKSISSAEVCFAKMNTNAVDFEIKLISEDSLKCPSDLSGQVISTKTFTETFTNGKYFCLDVKNYVVSSLGSGKNTIFITVAGKRVSKTGSTYIPLFGFDKSNKHTPYLKYELTSCVPDCTGKSCGDNKCGGSCGTCTEGSSCNNLGACAAGCRPNWQCTDWSACSNGKQTRTCSDANNCGSNDGKPTIIKDCAAGTRNTPDSVGVFTIPVSNFFLKNTLTGDVKDSLSFSFQKEAVLSRYLYGCTQSASMPSASGECFYTIPKKNMNCDRPEPKRRAYFYAGARYGSQVPLIGDWNGDGIDSIGIYDPIEGTFLLKNANSAGNEDIKFKFGKKAYDQLPSDEQYVFGRLAHYYYPLQYPVVGDWDGDGIDSIGLYNVFTSTFNLKNSNSEGQADKIIKFGTSYPSSLSYQALLPAMANPLCSKNEQYPSFDIIPITGDWDGDGKDSIGLYNLLNDGFSLTNELKDNLNPELTTRMYLYDSLNANSVYNRCQYALSGDFVCNFMHERVPVSGDWDGDGADEIGLYSQLMGIFYLKNDFNIKKSDSSLIGYDSMVNGVNGPTGDDSRQIALEGERYQHLLFKIPLSGHWNQAKSKTQCTPNCLNSDGSLKECGDNGCGGLCGDFGKIPDGKTCSNGKFVDCIPQTCSDIGKECGIQSDSNCRKTLNCGNCESKPETKCNANGMCQSIGAPVKINYKKYFKKTILLGHEANSEPAADLLADYDIAKVILKKCPKLASWLDSVGFTLLNTNDALLGSLYYNCTDKSISFYKWNGYTSVKTTNSPEKVRKILTGGVDYTKESLEIYGTSSLK